MHTTTSEIPSTRPSTRRIPGEPGLWLFLVLDMTFFAVIFGTFMYERAQQPELFATSRETLTIAWGAANTFVLLTSSLVVALALRCVREGALQAAERLTAIGVALGAVFVTNKAIEWGVKIDAGHVPLENTFFQLYYTAAGVHLLHVLIGISVLLYLRHAIGRARRRGSTASPTVIRNFESGAIYWHMVDLLWVVLFALLYLAI